ncbi:hypothetical protein MEN24_03370 [Dolichospermum sp. ST_sed10]|nr:hypothetical protein [Dolichospermum sp. ST_sed10]
MADKQLVEFTLDGGGTFLVEVEQPEDTAIERVALPSGQMVTQAKQTF